MKKFIKQYVVGLVIFILILTTVASLTNTSQNDTIIQTAAVIDILTADSDPAFGYAWNDNIGWINFGDSGTHNNGQVYVSKNKLYGYAWGENVGWISMNCENDGSCGTSNYVVTQSNSNGILTGYAWGENVGWINFAPAGGGVNITTNTSGVNTFSGYAWGENVGWVSFSGTAPDYGVSTNWTRHSSGGTTYQICTYTYSDWSPCINGEQTRTVSMSGDNCNNSEPLSQVCTIVATTTPPVATTTSPISISIYPVTSSIYTGEPVTFTANIVGTTSAAVWSIKEGSTVGTILPLGNLTGIFRAANATGTFHIIAKVKNDPTIIASSTIIINDKTEILPVGITISPKKTDLFTNQSFYFTASVTNSDNKRVTWIVSEEGGGTINSNGLYTAPDRAGTFHIIARSQADSSKTDIAIATVQIEEVEPILPPDISEIIDPEIPNNTPPSDNNNVLSLSNINQILIDKTLVLGASIQNTILGIQEIITSPIGSVVTKAVAITGVASAGIAATGVFAMNSTSLVDLLSLPFRLWGLLLTALGIKKRNRPWGTVYDSVTKQPIDPAYVTIKKIDSDEENMSITDLDGRYGFLVTPGKYLLAANKTNYTFPSKKIAGQNTDVLYNNLYFGEELSVESAGALINKNIPLDPVNFDWNEFAKGQKKLMKFYSKREKVIRVTTDWMFKIGFLISIISLLLVTIPYNLIVLILYVLLGLVRALNPKQKALGSLTDKNGNPLSFAIVRVFSPDLNNMEVTSKVANKIGRYYCLVPKGKYYIKIQKKEDDGNYTDVFTSGTIDADNGIIDKNFVV